MTVVRRPRTLRYRPRARALDRRQRVAPMDYRGRPPRRLERCAGGRWPKTDALVAGSM